MEIFLRQSGWEDSQACGCPEEMSEGNVLGILYPDRCLACLNNFCIAAHAGNQRDRTFYRRHVQEKVESRQVRFQSNGIVRSVAIFPAHISQFRNLPMRSTT